MFCALFRIALVGLLAFTPVVAKEAVTVVRVNPEVSYGEWEGWGTSLAWWAKVFGERDDLTDLFFTTKTVTIHGEELPGLGMNIARYNLGACSWNEIDGRKMGISKIILPYRQIEGYWLDGKNRDPHSAGWDWSVDASQRAMLLKARDRGANRFELFSNSPMWWMTANDNPSGGAKATDDNLPEKNYAAFATYLATVARHAKDRWGIAFTTVSPFNEPTSKWWFADCKQEGCHVSAPAQAKFLPVLRAELDHLGLKDLPIAASDESYYDEALATWKGFRPETKELVKQFNVHGYQMGKGNRADLYRRVVVEDRKPLWNSEHGDKDASGLEMARNFHRDMDRLHPVAWSYWQPLDGGGWGFFDTDMVKGTIKRVNPKLFIFAQYSRHIRPGMVILESGHAGTVAAYDTAGRTLILAVLNDGSARDFDFDFDFDFDLSAFNVPDAPVSSRRTQPSAGVLYQRQPVGTLANRRFRTHLPAHSLQTFEISHVTRHFFSR